MRKLDAMIETMEYRDCYTPEKSNEEIVFDTYPGLRFLKQSREVEEYSFGLIDGDLHVEVKSIDGYHFDYLLKHPEEEDFDSYQNFFTASRDNILIVKRMVITRGRKSINVTEELNKLTEKKIPIGIDVQSKHLQIHPLTISMDDKTEEAYMVRNLYLYGSSFSSLDGKCNGYVSMPLPVSDFSLCVLAHEFGHMLDEESLMLKVRDERRKKFINSWKGFWKLFFDETEIKREAEGNQNTGERNAHAIGLRMLRELGKRIKIRRNSLQRFQMAAENTLAGYEEAREFKEDSDTVANKHPERYRELNSRTEGVVNKAYQLIYNDKPE